MATFIRDTLSKTNFMVSDNSIGLMEIFIKVNLKTVNLKDLVNWFANIQSKKNMKDILKKIKSGVTVYILGILVAAIKDSFKKI